ncbi:FAD-dependent monooxygenase [Nocardia cyriacigeorgica]|uniref:FAD-dependent monooxygenase n=1 Tax=Nocardia cyriacigeorgica TaxID=135487 RepID=UPI001896215D|nr:FAD-dependent monooxygenase [Nocardia cyriacigeorgica]MBF6452417.1 FAD-dependent monooxygenase [Nocardia cyriacigeorgica]MBF6480963.1 FAD-dependent monooxygenase [Nocardia cyriacigeorgica]MBF6549586.1 FAD-dependent monooxygenase [Nocardia cyriacigeorgica]
MRNKTVLISGASIAGPALAYWLDRYGFDVTVVERAAELRPGGQAVDFKGATHLTVLERMGLLDAVRARRTGGADMVLVDAAGKRRSVISGDFTGGDLEILRGDLAALMYERTSQRCTYLFGDSISALTETADGVRVEFEHAPARTFDLVFGADGVHSRVRALTFGPECDYVRHRGYYYALANSGTGSRRTGEPRREVAYAHNAPGKLAVSGGPKAEQMYMFASPELDYARDDEQAQRRILKQAFAGVGWEVPRMLAELDEAANVYLDSLSVVEMTSCVRGRIALVGDAGYGNTLAGFGTGLAVVGAYVLAGELAVAGGDHTAAFPRYDEIMRRYNKIAGSSNPGRFLAPKSAFGIRARDWFLNSPLFGLMVKLGDKGANDIELRDYPALVAAGADSAER